MNYIKSCGFIAYKEVNNINYYLVIKSTNGDVGFPKGHMEYNESEVETAIREVKEETNIDVEIIKGFRYPIEYKLTDKVNTIKQSIYFIGKSISDKIIPLKSEVIQASFLPFNEAYDLLTFKETKEMIVKANDFLINMLKTS